MTTWGPWWWRKLSHDTRVTIIISTIVAVLLAVLGAVVAVAVSDGNDGLSEVTSSVASPTTDLTTSGPITITTTTARPTTTITRETTPESSAFATPPPGVQSFEITIESMSGSRVGPNLFQLTPGGARLGIQWDWVGLRADGTPDDGEDCQIIVRVTGAANFPAYRTDECSKSSGTMSANNAEEFKVPGDYTVSITDETTGATGTANFRVLG